MRRVGIVIALLCSAAGADSKPAPHCRAAFSMLKTADDFESAVGIAGCLTDAGMAFEQLYRMEDVASFRRLARSPSGGAQLYGLCGLERLRDPSAPTVRAHLLESKAKTSIDGGDELPFPEGSVGELLRLHDGGSPAEFDSACRLLAESRKPCSPQGAWTRLTCR
jgi:hypothetical protein